MNCSRVNCPFLRPPSIKPSVRVRPALSEQRTSKSLPGNFDSRKTYAQVGCSRRTFSERIPMVFRLYPQDCGVSDVICRLRKSQLPQPSSRSLFSPSTSTYWPRLGLLISSKVKVITSKFHFTACSSKKLFY